MPLQDLRIEVRDDRQNPALGPRHAGFEETFHADTQPACGCRISLYPIPIVGPRNQRFGRIDGSHVVLLELGGLPHTILPGILQGITQEKL